MIHGPLRLIWLSLICAVAVSCGASPTVDLVADSAIQEDQPDPVVSTSRDLTRDEAIAQLGEQAFLGFGDASCVIDALFDEVGVYDFTSELAMEEANQPELIEQCVSPEPSRQPTAPESTAVVREPAQEGAGSEAEGSASEGSGSAEPAEATSFELTAASMPAFTAGALATGSVQLGTRTVDYVTITPPGFALGSSAPVLIALPPGGQDLEITRNVAEFVYLQQAVERGWVVVSPASPGGRWWDPDNASLMPEMVEWIEAWVSIEGGLPHLGGMSNGGKSAFTIAVQNPNGFRSLMVYPGAPDAAANAALGSLSNMPVRMWVGGEDPGWVAAMEQAEATLRASGGDVELQVIPGEPHVIQSITDGIEIFDQLDAAR